MGVSSILFKQSEPNSERFNLSTVNIFDACHFGLCSKDANFLNMCFEQFVGVFKFSFFNL